MHLNARRTFHPENLAPMGLALVVGLILVVILAPWQTNAAFPGQNGKIAFDSPLARGTEVNTINPDTSGRAALTGTPVNDALPSWSPDGTRVVFVRPDPVTPAQTTIWVINANGTGATQLTFATDPVNPANNARDDDQPAFSGDGTRITFSRQAPTFEREIWVMNADGTGQMKITDAADPGGLSDSDPTWSPDSQLIAFTSEVGDGPDAVWTIKPDGTGLVNITAINGTVDAEEPNFSPDGIRLAFAHCAPADEGCFPHEIAITTATPGGPITEITTSPNNSTEDFYPAWSPDGTRIAFHREDYANQLANIFSVAASGGPVSQVTTGGQDRHPDWQPVFSSTPSGVGAAGVRSKACRGTPVTIPSTKGNDVIKGTPRRDVVHGLRGNDRIFGFKGKDRLCGGRGRDRIFGGLGPDIIFGGDDSDMISGGTRRDRLFGGTPTAPIKLIPDTCRGGPGIDFFRNCQRGG